MPAHCLKPLARQSQDAALFEFFVPQLFDKFLLASTFETCLDSLNSCTKIRLTYHDHDPSFRMVGRKPRGRVVEKLS